MEHERHLTRTKQHLLPLIAGTIFSIGLIWTLFYKVLEDTWCALMLAGVVVVTILSLAAFKDAHSSHDKPRG